MHITDSDCSSNTSSDTCHEKQQIYDQQNVGNACVYAEGYFRELKARQEALIKHLCRSAGDPAFAATREKPKGKKNPCKAAGCCNVKAVVHLFIWP